MFWDDILVDRPLLDDELIASIATIFGIKPLNVLVLRDIADTSIKISDVHQVVIEKTEIAGDFLCVFACTCAMRSWRSGLRKVALYQSGSSSVGSWIAGAS